MQKLVVLGCLAVMVNAASVLAADKKEHDSEAEAKQAALEDADQAKDHLHGESGKYQKIFRGLFHWYTEDEKAKQPNPEVVGTFVSDEADKNPGRTYLVKVLDNNSVILNTLKRSDSKKLLVQGKLRNAEKYLIIAVVDDSGASAPPRTRGGRGGL